MLPHKVAFRRDDELLGFRVVAVTPVENLAAWAIQLEHKCGARVLHLHCNDPENAFSINFPTPPPDDTGMPHILEHMVLAGSEKFPVKEPFFEMIKMSMATFINAMTGYDATYYPVCSNVEKDLFNLADVYFDAVFNPLLEPSTFAREAHHLEPVDPNDPTGGIRIDGIVYSEMKGVFSDPEAVLARETVRQLLPDTCYGLESGGDPEFIPDLTHERLREFHATHYHPSNSFIVLYGNIDTLKYLEFLAPRLDSYEWREPLAPINSQPRWSEPRLLKKKYSISTDEPSTEKTYLATAWITGDNRDLVDAAALRILALLLLGHEAAPLYKALIDSHLGADLVLSGGADVGNETTFRVGIEGSEPGRFEEFRDLMLGTLEKLARKPFDKLDVMAAFQQAAYETQEILPMFPLHCVFRVIGAWMGGLDPLAYLDYAVHYKAVRELYEADPLFFNHLIRARLIENPHRLDIVLEPEAGLDERIESALEAKLEERRRAMDADELAATAEAALALARENGTPNPPAAVALLPQLKTSDIPAEPRRLPVVVENVSSGNELLLTEMPTNGIVYLTLNFNLADMPERLWPYLSCYTQALNKFGTSESDFSIMARRVYANTGGIAARASCGTHVDGIERMITSISIGLKTVEGCTDAALDVLEELLFDLNTRDKERMRDVLTQVRAANRSKYVQNGNITVQVQAARRLTPMGYFNYMAEGLPQLSLSEGWVRDFERGNDEVVAAIEDIQKVILNRNRVTASVTAPEVSADAIRRRLDGWLGRMDGSPLARAVSVLPEAQRPTVEGLAAALQVAHSAMVMPAPHISHPDEPLLAIGAHLVTMDYILPEIRFKGNAYGAAFRHAANTGAFVFSSFRDPRLSETIEIFRRTVDFVKTAPWTQEDIDRGIIGVAKHDEAPLRPAEATAVALNQHLIGTSFEFRHQRRRRLLEATPESVRQALLEALEAGIPMASAVLIADRKRLEKETARLPEMTIEEVIK